MRRVSVLSRYAKPRWHDDVWKRVNDLTGFPLKPITRGALDDSFKINAGDRPRWMTVLYPLMLSSANNVLLNPSSSVSSSWLASSV
jgi:hypothetical protein